MRLIPLLLFVALAFAGCVTAKVERVARRSSTPDLKLRHAQLEQETGRAYFQFGGMGWGGMSNHDYDTEEKHAIERELLKRYQAGDKGAYLPIFGR